MLSRFPGGSDYKESACIAGDLALIPGLGRSPGEGNGSPLQYSGLENSMDRGAGHDWVINTHNKWNSEIVSWTLTWASPAVKAKGLRRHKVHSKAAGRCLYKAVNPRPPQKTVRRKTTRPVRKGFFTNTLVRKANVIWKERKTPGGPQSAGNHQRHNRKEFHPAEVYFIIAPNL